MRINKTITLAPAYHKWASQRTNFSEWVEMRIDDHVQGGRDHNPRISDAETWKLASLLLTRLQDGDELDPVIVTYLLPLLEDLV
jgi:hypothetical protein